MVVRIKSWNSIYAERIEHISEKRSQNRINTYLIREEITRVKNRLQDTGKDCSIRFGVEKKGKGLRGERGDFCLIAGVVEGRHLTLYYRSLELIGGFAYDLCLIKELGVRLGIDWKTVKIIALHARVFAVKGNSNQKLYPKLMKVLGL